MTLHCRVTRINMERLQLDLTCRSSDLLDKEGKYRLAVTSFGAVKSPRVNTLDYCLLGFINLMPSQELFEEAKRALKSVLFVI